MAGVLNISHISLSNILLLFSDSALFKRVLCLLSYNVTLPKSGYSIGNKKVYWKREYR